MTYEWIRQTNQAGTTVAVAHIPVAQVLPGKTLVRTVFGWSFRAVVPMWAFERIGGRPVYAGVQTVLNSFGGSLPDPGISPLGELSYPLERWLWWEAGEMTADGNVHYSDPASNITVRSVGTLNARDIETAVRNTDAVAGLGLYISVSCPDLVNLSLEGVVTGYGSALIRP